jgi:hypothetical protein
MSWGAILLAGISTAVFGGLLVLLERVFRRLKDWSRRVDEERAARIERLRALDRVEREP